MKRNEAIKFVLTRTLGNFLLLFSLYGVAATFGPALYYEAQFQLIQFRGVHFRVASEQEAVGAGLPAGRQGFGDIKKLSDTGDSGPGFSQILAGSTQQIIVPKDTQFSITIPKIGASAKVYPNVDPANPTEFLQVLQKGIAHAKGSVFPGFNGNVYLFAHSTDNWWNVGRYNAVFYLLKNLNTGDPIIVFFENRRYEYVVSQTLIIDPNDVSHLNRAQTGEQQLVLQTCWPPGTTWKRLIVIAKPK
ncbi:MAG TPA: sortase [Candidatus Saccharimonadales bacterium]|nr:sortase [Candidatus Saccharimonadales bacterium]